MIIKRRQGDRRPDIRVLAFTASGVTDLTVFPTITFRAVCGSTVIAGTAAGDASGVLTYTIVSGDLDVAGSYDAIFIATDGTGKEQTIPTGENITLIVVPDI